MTHRKVGWLNAAKEQSKAGASQLAVALMVRGSSIPARKQA